MPQSNHRRPKSSAPSPAAAASGSSVRAPRPNKPNGLGPSGRKNAKPDDLENEPVPTPEDRSTSRHSRESGYFAQSDTAPPLIGLGKGKFSAFARATARAAGHPIAFALAALIIVAWALTGPIFGFSDTWQLIINTGTTIATFLMVFLIQNTQNREGQAIQIKLDELIRCVQGGHNALLNLEELTTDELDRVQTQYNELAEAARKKLRRGGTDTDTPDVKPEPITRCTPES